MSNAILPTSLPPVFQISAQMMIIVIEEVDVKKMSARHGCTSASFACRQRSGRHELWHACSRPAHDAASDRRNGLVFYNSLFLIISDFTLNCF